MTQERFEALVRRLEQTAQRSPRAYRLRVVAFAALAYAYIGAVLGVALALLAGLVAAPFLAGRGHPVLLKLLVKAGLPLGALGLAILRALRVRLDAPEGLVLARADHPELFAAIDRARRHMRAPRAHRVLLTSDYNAAVVQQPRLGVLGWQRNHLILGLPLLQVLSPEQLEAVLAHEFGHLSGSHGRLGGWIYRTSVTLGRLHEQMESERHWASFVFLPFFRWFWPRFDALSFVQRRAQEYAADLGGAEITSPRQMADALVAVRVRGTHLDLSHWEAVKQRADELPQPDGVAPFAEMGPQVLENLREADAEAWLQEALAIETGVADTHPSLRDRLSALGEAPRIPPPLHRSAAQALLGQRLPSLAAQLDAAWRDQVRESWQQRYEYVCEARARLDALAKRAATGELSEAEAFEQAELVEEQRGPQEALPLYRNVLGRDAGHLGARFAVGRILAGRDDPRCLEHLDAAISTHDDAIIPGCRHAYAFLERAGRMEEAQAYAERARQHHQRLEAAREERSALRLDDRYELHGLAADELAALLDFLRAHPAVEQAWLVRRQLDHFPEEPLFALGVRRRRRGLLELVSDATRKQRDLALQQELLEAPLPGETFVLVLNHRGRRERALFERVEGAQVLSS